MDYKLPDRIENSNKSTYGKVLNIAGSKFMTGAAYLSSVSALKTGCGYLFLACENEVRQAVAAQTQNIVFAPLSDIDSLLKSVDVLEIGCGLSTSLKAAEVFRTAIESVSDIPVIIDADGLNLLAKMHKMHLPQKLVLTPHPKEAARLLNIELENVLADFEGCAKKICQKYNGITVLKSHKTVVCDNDRVYYNETGNNALAKAGSGDVLTGIIAGLAAQKMDLFEAASLGTYLHGVCGDLARNDLTEYCVMASDLIDYLPEAIRSI